MGLTASLPLRDRRWRLLIHPPGPAAWNMAVDLALFRGQAEGSPPTLRLYRWQQPTLSLGAGQKLPAAFLEKWRTVRLPLVRRPTGGRAVLHGWDLTYCFTAGPAAGFPLQVRAVYRLLNQALQRGLARLGLQTDLADQRQSQPGPAPIDCFAAIMPGDLLGQGRKLCGSAQVWQGGTFLQHGSLWLESPPAALLARLRPDFTRSRSPSTALAEILGPVPSWLTVVEAIIAGFQDYFGVALLPADLTSAERLLLRASHACRFML